MPKRTSRRGLFTSRNNLFSFGRRKSKQTAGRTITSKRTELGRRLEALEDRRMLSVSPATVEFDTATAFSAGEDGTGGSGPGLFVEVSGSNLIGTPDSGRRLRIDLSASGTAEASDFSPATQFVTIPALDYSSSKIISLLASDTGKTGSVYGLQSGGVTITDDATIESTEDFGIELTDFGADIVLNNGVSNVSSAAASVNITDNDEAKVSIVDQKFSEATGTAMVEIKLDTGGSELPADITVDVSTSDSSPAEGSATEGSDYTEYSEDDLKIFSAGSKGGSFFVPVSIDSDNLVEGDEVLTVTLSDLMSSGPGVVFASGGDSADITIEDDDTVTLSFSKSSDSAGEPIVSSDVDVDVDLVFSTTGSGKIELATDLTVGIDITPDTTATNVTDFTLSASSLTFTGTDTKKTLTISVIGDPLVEGDEIVDLDLSLDSSTPAGLIDQASLGAISNYELTIVDDDAATLSISSTASVDELNPGALEPATLKYTVSLTKPAANDITVPVALDPSSTATLADSDYTAPGVTEVVIIQGTLSAFFDVTVNEDNVVEADESLIYKISDPGVSGVTLGTDTATSTIANDDTSKVSILAGMTKIDESAGTATFSILLSQESSSATTVSFSPSFADGDIDAADIDVSGIEEVVTKGPSPVVFAAGEQLKFITVPIVNDSLLEAPEDLVMAIDSVVSTGGLAVSIDGANGKATTTIEDNDPVTVSVSDATVVEGDAGTTKAMVTVSIDNTLDADLEVTFDATDSLTAPPSEKAKSGVDYTAITDGTVTISKGSKTATILVDVIGDGDVEPDEIFDVVLKSTDNSLVKVSPTAAQVTITNDDDAIVSISGDSVTEGGMATITLTNTGSTTETFFVELMTIDQTAVEATDFSGIASKLVEFKAGTTSNTDLMIATTQDSVVEGLEQFAVQIINVWEDETMTTPANGVTVTTDTTNVIISDDDTATVSISGDVSIDEGNPAAAKTMQAITFTTDKKAQHPIVLSYTSTDVHTDGDDYSGGSGTATIKPGDFDTTVYIEIGRDLEVEGDENFEVSFEITSSTGTVGEGTDKSTVTINNDDSATVDVLDFGSILEGTSGTSPGPFGTTLVNVTVELTGDVQDAFDVDLKAMGLSAADHNVATGKVSFPADSKSGATMTFPVEVVADDIVEPDEVFNVAVTGVSNSDISDAGGETGEITIEDDDTASISIVSEQSQPEGKAGTSDFFVDIELSGYVQEAFEFKFDVSDGTATTGDSDYIDPGTGTLKGVFPANSMDGHIISVPFEVVGDVDVEDDETVIVDISDIDSVPTGGMDIGVITIGDGSEPVTITNDDSLTVTITKPSDGDGAEDAGTSDDGEFLVNLVGGTSSETLFVTLSIGGSATAGADYSPVGTVVTFNPGDTTKSIPVTVLDDLDLEGDETVVATIQSVVGTDAGVDDPTIGVPSSATVTIEDNEVEITDISIKGATWTVDAYSLTEAELHTPGDPDSTLPWVNLNTIEVTFSKEPVGTLNDDTLSLVGVSGATYTPTS